MREIKPGTWMCQTLMPIFGASDTELSVWLASQTAYRFGLAHADDGVIWGHFENGGWRWSSGVVANSPQLRVVTLQQLRLFGPEGEVFVWRGENGFSGRTITDGQGQAVEYFDEVALLWGMDDDPNAALDGFQPRKHGAEGLRHAPPVEIANAGSVMARNYVDDDENGCARIVASRLMNSPQA